MIINKKNMALVLISAMFFLILDRFLKNSAFQYAFPLIGSWLKFNFVPNYNIAFSLPLSGIWLNFFILFLIFSISAYIFFLFAKRKLANFELWGLTFIIFGAISNLIDRFRFGYVIDYFDCRFFSVFNVADIMITFGIIVLVLNLYLKRQKTD